MACCSHGAEEVRRQVTQEISGPDGVPVSTITKIELVAAPIAEGIGEA
jgi:hypothetical protein